MTTAEHMPETSVANVHCYEEVVTGQPDSFEWPPSMRTKRAHFATPQAPRVTPKVFHSHRFSAAYLRNHDARLDEHLSADVVLLIVPMFHVNAWGNPYACPSRAKMVMPGNKMGDGPTLATLINEEGVTMSAVFHCLVEPTRTFDQRYVDTLQRVVVGGLPARCQSWKSLTLTVLIPPRLGHDRNEPAGHVELSGARRNQYDAETFASMRTNVVSLSLALIRLPTTITTNCPGTALPLVVPSTWPWICSSYQTRWHRHTRKMVGLKQVTLPASMPAAMYPSLTVPKT